MSLSISLKFVRSTDDGHSVYLDSAGTERYLQDGTRRELFYLDSLDLEDVWRDFLSGRVVSATWQQHSVFREHLVEMLVAEDRDSDAVDEINWCGYCDGIAHEDAMTYIEAEYVCEPCVDSRFSSCDNCENLTHRDYLRYTLDEDRVCESCSDNSYGYCDSCDGIYHFDGSHRDHCSEGCDCEAPGQSFSVPIGDGATLKNDTRHSISLAAGFLSDEGIGQIANLIRQHGVTLSPSNAYVPGTNDLSDEYRVYQAWMNFSYEVSNVGAEWQTKDGNFTKRLSKYAYKNHGLKVTPEILTQVGNIGQQHSQGTDVEIEFTRDLNQSASEFGHEDSCWWQSYYASRCTLKNNGGMGLRTFDDNDRWNPVTGRAWVMPLKAVDGTFEPTSNTETPDAYIVFNGYGKLGGYAPARIMAALNGMTYRKVDFYAEPMYVNSEAGYLVGPEDLIDPHTDGSLTLDLDDHSGLYNREQAAALVNA